MRFARWVFLLAGIYGLAVMVPQYFMEAKVGRDYPPEITHPEYFYGFVGVGIAWQIAFLIIARDPARFRTMMIPGMVEKVTFGVAALVLCYHGRLAEAGRRICCDRLVIGDAVYGGVRSRWG